MRSFRQNDLGRAYQHARDGGQALHLISGRFAYLRRDTPACFKGRTMLAHLFDQDVRRLEATARALGVRVIKVERPGTERQHIDLCAGPLARALELVRRDHPDDPTCPVELHQNSGEVADHLLEG